ncbi:MAG: DegQ family serine endoprotease [Acetobacteraceae bacterium]|nr:DegQ family serine endoprotease [Acetobacteraceae bacterium]
MRLAPSRTPAPSRPRRRGIRAALLAATALAAVTGVAGLGGSGLGPPAAVARPAPDSFADLAQQLLPAVVNISSSTSVQARGGIPGPEIPMFPPGSPFEQFFKDFLDRNRPGGHPGVPGMPGQPGPQGQQQTPAPPERRMQSLGSGFIIDPAGIVVTNNHVIEGADEVTVTLQDNTALKATVIGRDERVDVAVLKVTTEHPLTAVPFGDSDKERVGDWVLAIGNPFGLGGTVTAGIVSARGRDIRQGPYDDFIQTDAAINRGNSGGPLFNMEGQVIGINTAIYSPSGGSIGIGFSIPANMAHNVVDQLRQFGHARRGWLGVRIQQVTPDIAESLGLKDSGGAMVAGVNDGGPADEAKIRNGDVIIKFNNQDVKEMRNLPRIVAETPIGINVPVMIWRDGQQQTLQAKVGELPDDQQQVADASATAPSKQSAANQTTLSGLGLQVSPITQDAREKYQLGPDLKGVVVTGVDASGSAAERGIKVGDVIVEVGSPPEPVGSPTEVQNRVDSVRKQNRKSVLMLIQGQEGAPRWVPLTIGDVGGGEKGKPG